MRNVARFALGCTLALAVAAVASAQTVEIRLNDGSRWKGQVSDVVTLKIKQQGVEIELTGELVAAAEWHVTILTDVAGAKRQKTVFKGDIIEMKTTQPAAPENSRKSPAAGVKAEDKADGGKGAVKPGQPGVFVLPLEKMVGLYFRHEEMEKIAEEADKYGPGQIIVLDIDSGGGAVTEMEKIHETLTEIGKRHRLVAWIKQAISAGCATAMHCHEIYFRQQGTAGAMTAFNGATGQAWKGKELDEWLKRAGDWMEQGGRSPYIAEAMIDEAKLLSYDKDPVTGKVTFYGDLSGAHVLSGPDENLVFTATSAVDCGFADGIADNEAELAKLLDLPEWNEISDYGRKIAKDWYATVDKANGEVQRLMNRLQYAGTGSGDPAVMIGKRIQILQDILRWADRCPNCLQGLQREDLEREIRELRKELADMKKG